jgi:acetate kinase
MKNILVANAGSSSVKFQVFAADGGGKLARVLKGQMDGIGTRPRLRASRLDGRSFVDREYAIATVPDVPAALQTAAAWLQDEQRVEPSAVGHRVVHGGPDYTNPVLINAEVLARLERYVPLAPLHQPHNLAPIRSILKNSPQLPQVACFDTAFHRDHPAVADHYAIPAHLYAEGVRRYGFHGLSYEYIASCLPKVAPEAATGRVIVAHLGSGASMCALAGGRSIESTMGFTTLDGLPMGTRPGQIDPGVILYLFEQKKMSGDAVQNFLYRECGLRGLSGISNDVRELQTSADPRAAFSLEYFCHRIALHAGMLAAALGGLDAFVFTAGIGENSAEIRARVVARLAWLGAVLDPKANAAHALRISASESRVALYVIPTDEELMIARHTLAALSAESFQSRPDLPPDRSRISTKASAASLNLL